MQRWNIWYEFTDPADAQRLIEAAIELLETGSARIHLHDVEFGETPKPVVTIERGTIVTHAGGAGGPATFGEK